MARSGRLCVTALFLAAGCAAVETQPGTLAEAKDTAKRGWWSTVSSTVFGRPRQPSAPYVLASLDDRVPANFTGCIEDTGRCYVIGGEVDVEIRFEPQTGRYWFLDPSSGNTYFADGELRTGDAFRALRAVEAGERALLLREGDLVLEPGGDTPEPEDE